MGRAEMRRARKDEKKYKTVTYTLTQEQLDKIVRDKIGDELKRVKKRGNRGCCKYCNDPVTNSSA